MVDYFVTRMWTVGLPGRRPFAPKVRQFPDGDSVYRLPMYIPAEPTMWWADRSHDASMYACISATRQWEYMGTFYYRHCYDRPEKVKFSSRIIASRHFVSMYRCDGGRPYLNWELEYHDQALPAAAYECLRELITRELTAHCPAALAELP